MTFKKAKGMLINAYENYERIDLKGIKIPKSVKVIGGNVGFVTFIVFGKDWGSIVITNP